MWGRCRALQLGTLQWGKSSIFIFLFFVSSLSIGETFASAGTIGLSVLSSTVWHFVQRIWNNLPWISRTFFEPARRWSSSTFWVTIESLRSLPSNCLSMYANVLCALFGSLKIIKFQLERDFKTLKNLQTLLRPVVFGTHKTAKPVRDQRQRLAVLPKMSPDRLSRSLPVRGRLAPHFQRWLLLPLKLRCVCCFQTIHGTLWNQTNDDAETFLTIKAAQAIK